MDKKGNRVYSAIIFAVDVIDDMYLFETEVNILK